MRFTVIFGPESCDVEAANADDAWSAFCATSPTALKHPNQYRRLIRTEMPAVPPEVERMTETVVEEPAMSAAVPVGRQDRQEEALVLTPASDVVTTCLSADTAEAPEQV